MARYMKVDGDLIPIGPGPTEVDADTVTGVASEAYVDSVADAVVTKDEVTIVIIPDTQYLSRSINTEWIAHINAAAQYVEDNRESLNVQLILHLGDVVENGQVGEFDRMNPAMTQLWELGVPMAACIGNHDYDGDPNYSASIVDRDRTTRWNTYYGQDRYTSKPWFDGGFMEAGKSENMYLRCKLEGRPTLVLVLDLYATSAAMTWADGIIEDHPLHDVIVLTHSFLYQGERIAADGPNGPDSYTNLTDPTPPTKMWDDHLSKHHNVVMVVNGHHISENVSQRFDFSDEGTAVLQQFTNWQEVGEGGDGRLVLMGLNVKSGVIRRRIYNPRSGLFEAEPYSGPGPNEISMPYASRVSTQALDQKLARAEDTFGAVGRWAAPHSHARGASSSNNTARIFYVPVWAAQGEYDEIALEITTAVADSLFRLGVYEVNASGAPGGRLVTTGDLSGAVAGIVTSPISLVHPGGFLFVACKANDSISWQAVGGPVLGMPWATAGGSVGPQCYRQTQSGSNITLPATASAGELLENNGLFAPSVRLRRSA